MLCQPHFWSMSWKHQHAAPAHHVSATAAKNMTKAERFPYSCQDLAACIDNCDCGIDLSIFVQTPFVGNNATFVFLFFSLGSESMQIQALALKGLESGIVIGDLCGSGLNLALDNFPTISSSRGKQCRYLLPALSRMPPKFWNSWRSIRRTLTHRLARRWSWAMLNRKLSHWWLDPWS